MSAITQRQTDPSILQPSIAGATPERQDQSLSLQMPVDIYEEDSGITLYADMPGVDAAHLRVEVSGDTLLLQGDLQLDVPSDSRGLYADVTVTRYRRLFAVSRELDMEHIEANLKDGVLTIHLPKKEIYRPRRISVQLH